MRTIRYLFYLVTTFGLPLTLNAQAHLDSIAGSPNQGTYSLDILEMGIITPEQVEAYRNGVPPSEIILSTGETLENLLKATVPKYEVEWLFVSAGGVSGSTAAVEDSFSPELASSNRYELVSSIGLFVVGDVSGGECGGDYELRFGILEDTTGLFSDGFECGDVFRWSNSEASVP